MPSPTIRPRDRAEALALAREHGVRYVRLTFADILGQSKHVTVPVARLEEALDGRVTFDGGAIDGFVRDQEIDMTLRPDARSFALLPADPRGAREARVLCELVLPDGEPFEGCPRTTLRRIVETAAEALPGLRAALEVEFYLFPAVDGRPVDLDDPHPAFDDERGERVRDAIVEALGEMGIPVDAAYRERGAGQHELDFGFSGVVEAADRLLTVRTVAKLVAARMGMHATFMPKPVEASAGSGLHLSFAWGREAEPQTPAAPEPPPEAFEGEGGFELEEEREREAQELYAALQDVNSRPDELLFGVGGLLRHVSACTAICNPTINSYKRLVAAWDAPLYTVWSRRSANALVRVPPDAPARVEMRSPDPSCNPYLAFAVLVASLVDGVRRRTLPGEAWTGNAYVIGEEERVERAIRILPRSLRQALEELDDDAVVRSAIGDHIYHAFRDAKTVEYETYRKTVHPWERRAYLGL